MKVIGAGFGRTGTASRQSALQKLGFGPCYHMYEVFEHPEHADFWEAALRGEPVDWDEVLGSYEATVDWPACTFYGELMERYPDAKVLLNVRDPSLTDALSIESIVDEAKDDNDKVSKSTVDLRIFGDVLPVPNAVEI